MSKQELIEEALEEAKKMTEAEEVEVKDKESETDMEDEKKVEESAETVEEAVAEKEDEDTKKKVAQLAKESVDLMFSDMTDLSEDFKTKATTVFEAAFGSELKSAVAQIQESLEADYNQKLEEAKAQISEQVDEYLNYVVQEWVQENQLQVTSALKLEIAESFMKDVTSLMESYNIDISDDKLDLYEEAVEEAAEMKAEVNKLTESLIEQSKEILSLKKKDVIADLSEGLADTQVEKFKSLVEDVEAKDLETFKEKAQTVRETFFKEEQSTLEVDSGETVIVESVEVKQDQPKFLVDPSIAKYVQSAKMTNR